MTDASRNEISQEKIVHRLFAPTEIGLIVVFRVLFGSVMLYEVYRYFTYGWIRSHFIDPQIHFTFYGFGWVHPWPGNGMYWHFAGLGILAGMMAVGLFYRQAAILFCLGFAYVFLLEQAYYLNHFYLVLLLSITAMFLPANRSCSLDVWRRPELRSETVPAWTLWLLRFQISSVYFFGGIAKLDADWLEGAFIRIVFSKRPDFPLIGQFFQDEWMVMSFAYGGLLFDLFIVPLLFWKRTRIPAYVAVIVFHTTNARLFQIGIFPIFMVAGSMIFFPADSLKPEPTDEKPKKKSKKKQSPEKIITEPSGVAIPRWVTVGLIGLFVGYQILMPLRHFLYPGNPNWTEEGHRFAWHMKLRAKSAEATFHATNGKGEAIDLSEFDSVLNDKQSRTMPGRPDMVLQYTHYLADELRKRGHSEVQIRVESAVSLNRREPQPLIDPQVNLAAEKRNLRHANWILPLKIPLPKR